MTIEIVLPKLPEEDMFWRVGDHRDGEAIGVPRVFLMRKGKTYETYYFKPVRSEKWWNRGEIIGEEKVPTIVHPQDKELAWEGFTLTLKQTEAPSFAKKFAPNPDDDGLAVYRIPLSAEGVAFVAHRAWKKWLRIEELRREKIEHDRLIDEAKERFFGDYPPLKLEER